MRRVGALTHACAHCPNSPPSATSTGSRARSRSCCTARPTSTGCSGSAGRRGERAPFGRAKTRSRLPPRAPTAPAPRGRARGEQRLGGGTRCRRSRRTATRPCAERRERALQRGRLGIEHDETAARGNGRRRAEAQREIRLLAEQHQQVRLPQHVGERAQARIVHAARALHAHDRHAESPPRAARTASRPRAVRHRGPGRARAGAARARSSASTASAAASGRAAAPQAAATSDAGDAQSRRPSPRGRRTAD